MSKDPGNFSSNSKRDIDKSLNTTTHHLFRNIALLHDYFFRISIVVEFHGPSIQENVPVKSIPQDIRFLFKNYKDIDVNIT